MKVSMKNWRQNRMKQFGFTLFYGFIVWLWSWSLPVLRLCYRMLTGIHVRKSPKGCRTCDHSDSEWSGILSQRVNPTCSVFGWKSGPHRRIYKYFSLSTPDYFYWQLEQKLRLIFLYPCMKILIISMFEWFCDWVAIVLQDYKEVYISTREKRRRESSCGGFWSRQPIVLPFLFPILCLTI